MSLCLTLITAKISTDKPINLPSKIPLSCLVLPRQAYPVASSALLRGPRLAVGLTGLFQQNPGEYVRGLGEYLLSLQSDQNQPLPLSALE